MLLAQEQSNTIRKLDAAGMGGGTAWVQPDRAERERLALEAVTPAVELGADLNADNGDGRTALDAAKASFLVEKGATRGRDEKEAEQAPTPAPSKGWPAPRTLDGRPDLQGIWTNATVTPLERPRELAGKEFFTAREAAEYERRIVEQNNADRRRDESRCRPRHRLQRRLVGAGNEGRLDEAHIAHRRSPQRNNPAAHARRAGEGGRPRGGAPAASSRRTAGLNAGRPLHRAGDVRTAHAAGRLQQ